ncbi:MAG: repair protein RecO [Miltoncostaeaceae bacterium]|nr:repair protein RecO [Miltoncostaeaceae bacterium]
MASYDTEAVVLRAIRYGEADSVLTLYTRDRGRASAIAKGARKTTSRLGGRLQPGVRAQVTIHEGRSGLGTLRAASVIEAHAGLWAAGYRLQAASCLLESVMRILPQEEPNDEAYHLLSRALALLARIPVPDPPATPRLDPILLASQCKLLVVSGLFPRLGSCAHCGSGPPLPGFSAAAGGALCQGCADGGDPLSASAWSALAGLVGRPLAEAADACPPAAALGVERVVGLVLREHLGVVLRSAAPPDVALGHRRRG